MSINRAMQSGVTALNANAAALATISNNIANSNTTGFKRVLTNFTNLVSGSSTVSNYASNGVTAVVQQTMTQRGELNASSGTYSLGIDGQGFFVTSDNPNPVSAASTILFTRDGSFTTDTQGYLTNAAGLYLEGWPADTNGNINTGSTDITKLGPINVSNISNPPVASTMSTFTANLDASTPVSTGAAAYDVNTKPMSTYDGVNTTSTKPDSTISMTVSDSQGKEHTLNVSLLNLGVDTNASSPTLGKTLWAYEVYSPDITGTTAGLNQLSTGTLAFDPDGKLDTSLSSTMVAGAAAAFNTDLTIGASNTVGVPRWNDALGIEGQAFSLGLSGASGQSKITQLAGDSTTTAMSVNGTEFGSLTKVEIGDDGVVTAIYNNGDQRKLAKVAIATFINANGLTPISGNAFTVSSASGGFSLKSPGEGGAGNLSPGALEASTVDLAQEFTGLITTQRAYSAASKVITTADDMLQELLAIKR